VAGSTATHRRGRLGRPATLVPYPNFPDKHLGSPLVTPQRFLDYARARSQLADFDPPAGVLLLYQRSAMASLIQREEAEQLPVQYPLYKLPRTGGVVGLVGNFGIGGPMVGIVVEELAALGVRYFFSFGLAGGLQPLSRVGDIVVCTRAIRDEGVSHHYLPPETAAVPSPHLTRAVGQRLTERGAAFRRGMTWTIDTPYRETVDEVRHYRCEGVLTVEMEAAALFAVAAVRGVQAASVFVLSDLLGETEWTPEFGADLLNSQLELVADAGIQAILDLATS
jgi:uridine phosphorylase